MHDVNYESTCLQLYTVHGLHSTPVHWVGYKNKKHVATNKTSFPRRCWTFLQVSVSSIGARKSKMIPHWNAISCYWTDILIKIAICKEMYLNYSPKNYKKSKHQFQLWVVACIILKTQIQFDFSFKKSTLIILLDGALIIQVKHRHFIYAVIISFCSAHRQNETSFVDT